MNAQLIQGTYTGAAGSAGTYDSIPDSNIPLSHLPNAGFLIMWVGNMVGSSTYYNASYGHIMMWGTYLSNAGPANPVLNGPEAQAFDSKYDDGSPATGNILSWTSGGTYSPNCTTSNSSSATYSTSAAKPICSFIFITGF